MFYENWRSRADLDAHMTMPHLKPLQSRLDDLLARPPDIRFYEISRRPLAREYREARARRL